MPSSPCLELEGISFAYPDGPSLLEEASFLFDQGGYYLVRGPSGSGKSTLLRLLCRLEEPQCGRLLYHGKPLDKIDPAAYRRRVAYVQQMPTLLAGPVRDNLLLPLAFKANDDLNQPTDSELQSMLDSFLLEGVSLDSQANALSVGQSQRVCLIRSLLLGPEVLLMDEPTASLDMESARVVLDKAQELKQDGMTVVMISHSEERPTGVTHEIRLVDKKLRCA